MNYFFLVAGRGTRMQPLTMNYPKTLFKLDKDTTVISRMIDMIRELDSDPRIIVVTGFKHEMIEESVKDVILINNPFYAVTNSLGSLWFAKEYMEGPSILINGDVLLDKAAMSEVVCTEIARPEDLLDSSIKKDGDYNVEVIDDKVVVMGKELKSYYGEFAGITRLDVASVRLMKDELEHMIQNELYDQWYENALIQMVFERNFDLYYRDICNYGWTEVDEANDLLLARRVYRNDCKNDG